MFHSVSKTGGDLAVLSMTGSFPCLEYLCVSERRPAGVIPQQIGKVALFQVVCWPKKSTPTSFKLVSTNWIKPFELDLLILHLVSLRRNKNFTFIDFSQWFPDLPYLVFTYFVARKGPACTGGEGTLRFLHSCRIFSSLLQKWEKRSFCGQSWVHRPLIWGTLVPVLVHGRVDSFKYPVYSLLGRSQTCLFDLSPQKGFL